MPRSLSIPAGLYRRAPPPPPRQYHPAFGPALGNSLTIESGDGTLFCIPASLLARSSFISDLYSLPGNREIVLLHGISASVLAFALQCAHASRARRARRHSMPIKSDGYTKGLTGGPLLPANAWSWGFMTQVLTLAFAYDLPHALERLAEDSGNFYDPVLGYTLWSLLSAAKGEGERSSALPGRIPFPTASTSILDAWAHALLRYEGAIPSWCTHALDTHLPAALDSLEELLSRRQEIVGELAAAEERIATGISIRKDDREKRHSWDIFSTSVATLFLRVDKVDNDANQSPPRSPSPPSRRVSLRKPTCTQSCKVVLKRKLTAAAGLATRTCFTEKFGTLQYFVEYTYEGISCAACRAKVKDALVWVWCMKTPWRGV